MTDMKVCSKCLVEKSVDSFYWKKGPARPVSPCKECSSLLHKRYYSENRAPVLIRMKRNYQVNREEIYQRNKECKAKYKDRYLERSRLYTKESYSRHKPHFQARKKTLQAIEKGLLTRLPCICCGNPEAEAHHSDYTKPLDVLWLCPTHHDAWHRVFKAEG